MQNRCVYVKIIILDQWNGAIRTICNCFNWKVNPIKKDSQDLNIILNQLRYNCLFVLLVKYSLTFAKLPLPTYYYHYRVTTNLS